MPVEYSAACRIGRARVLGVVDDVDQCDCCGKQGLKRTVALEWDDGSTTYYGTDCAARALRTKASRVESAARQGARERREHRERAIRSDPARRAADEAFEAAIREANRRQFEGREWTFQDRMAYLRPFREALDAAEAAATARYDAEHGPPRRAKPARRAPPRATVSVPARGLSQLPLFTRGGRRTWPA